MPKKRICNISMLNHDAVEEESSSVEENPQKGPRAKVGPWRQKKRKSGEKIESKKAI
jgi:hypothetical protein